MNEILEIVYCGESRTDNKIAADLHGQKLGKSYQLTSITSLEQMASYLKNENLKARGVIAFRRDKEIMSSGASVISDFDLLITSAFRVNMVDELCMGDIPILRDCQSKQKLLNTKDYFVVSSSHGILQGFNSAEKKNWQTLLIAEYNDIHLTLKIIDSVMAACNIDLCNIKTYSNRLYLEVRCHCYYLSEFIEILKQHSINFKVLGSYIAPEERGGWKKKMSYEETKKNNIRNQMRPKRTKKHNCYFVR